MLRYAANICNGDEFFIQCVCCLLFLLLFCCCCYICCYRLSMCFLLLDKLKLSLRLNCEQAGKIIKIAPHYNHSFRAIKSGPNLPGMPFKRSTNVSKRFKMFSACRCYHTQCGTVGRIITISSDRLFAWTVYRNGNSRCGDACQKYQLCPKLRWNCTWQLLDFFSSSFLQRNHQR